MSSVSPAQMKLLRKIFDEFDKDKSGFIERSELQVAVNEYRKADGSRANAQAIMMGGDQDKDGVITFDEFVEAAQYSTNRSGDSTSEFNGFIGLVARAYVRPSDSESIEYLKSYKFWPPPVFMVIITIVQISLYAYYAAIDCTAKGLPVSYECPPTFRTALAFRPGCREQVWRFFTYMLVHSGIYHIVFNLAIQLVMGFPLEMIHGPFRVAGLYIVGVIAGSLASSVCDPTANVVGASAAVYALVGAHVADLFINWAEMTFRWIRAAVLGALVIADLSLSLYNRYGKNDTSVSYVGHFAGFIMGITLGVILLRNLRKTTYEVWALRIGVVIAIVGFLIALFFNIFYKGYPDPTFCNGQGV